MSTDGAGDTVRAGRTARRPAEGSAPRAACCAAHGACARRQFATMAELTAALGPACRLLPDGLAPAAMVLPDLFAPLATTTGRGATLIGRGPYAPFQAAGAPFSCAPGAVTIRLAVPEALSRLGTRVAVAGDDADTGRPAALHVFDDDGTLMHRADMTEPDDMLILAAAAAPLARPAMHETGAVAADNVVALAAHRTARRGWHERSVADHLDDILADGRGRPCRRIDRLAGAPAFRAQTRLLPDALAYLERQRVPFTRIVPADLLCQAGAGPLDRVGLAGGVLVLQSGDETMLLTPAAATTCYAVTYGTGTAERRALELFTAEGRPSAVLLGGDGTEAADPPGWTALIRSLPRA